MERSRALAETAAETLAGGDVVAFDSSSRRAVGAGEDVSTFEQDAGRSFGARLLRAMLRCACGSMPPGMVTDISAALFATWAACGDRVFGTWLAEALGGDRDGFPRKSTTRDQKASFVNELLGAFGEAPGTPGRCQRRTRRETLAGGEDGPAALQAVRQGVLRTAWWASSGVFRRCALDYRARSNVSRADVESDATDVSERVPAIARKVLFSRKKR